MKRLNLILAAMAFTLLCADCSIASEKNAEGWEIGVSAYSFRKFNVFETIEKTRDCGGEVIEFFLWQKLGPAYPDVIFNQNLTDEQIATVKAKLAECGVRAVNAYFSNDNLGKDEADLRKLFVFAQKLGLRGLTGEPPVEKLDLIEKLVKEFDIQLCFHNHARDAKRPNYRNWDPVYLMALMERRDRRMGFSVDTGHIYRSGMDPVTYLRTVQGRVFSIHLKDIKEPKYGSPDVLYGKGIGNISAVLQELKRQQFKGHIGVEFDQVSNEIEKDVKDCIDYIRAWK
ncbi:MAG: TIM barrel protein [Kiritimatiellia bacterium]|jgi:sugar phosphate isomerase/epimerase